MVGRATLKVMFRDRKVFGDERFAQPARTSVSHLYNLSALATYRRQHCPSRPTKAV